MTCFITSSDPQDPYVSDLKSDLQRTLGDAFTLERELEGGGMSRVFLVRDQQLGRRVVVKTLADDSGVSVSAERFRREIRLAASLQQANIVPVHSAGDVGGIPYYTMPLVEGETLRAHLEAKGALDVREAVNILRDVARALAFAHERGVVHRDIKPENILLSGSTAVVTDFGIAKAIEASHSMAGAATLTQLGTLLGTPAYMAPEQAAGDPNIDHLADIYSLGVVAYEMLAGARPFPATTARAQLAAHISEAPPPLAGRRTGVPPRLASLVMKCLEKEPMRRPASASEVLQTLDSAAVTEGSTAPPTGEARPSIAVVPFANLSPDSADEFLADGLTDEIITDFAGVHGIHVIARAAMMRFKGTDKQPGEVARELHVRYVLEGSVRRAGPSLRLTARLVDTADDTTLWSDKLTGTVDDVFEMQERVSKTIVGALQVKLTAREVRHLAELPMDDLEAYAAYLQAKQAIWSFSAESLARAEQLLRDAMARVGENPRLLAALGSVYVNAITGGGADTSRRAADAEECAQKLTALYPDSSARYALSGLLHWRRGEMREAIATLDAAHEREPGNVDVLTWLQYALLMAGKDERAREVSRLIVKLDPLTPLMQIRPQFCDLLTGRARETLSAYARFVERDSSNPLAHFWLMCIRAEAGDVARIREPAHELIRRWPDIEFSEVATQTLELLDHPERAAAAPLPSRIRPMAAESETIARSLSWLYARLGATDAALDALEHAIRRGFAHYPHLARESHSLSVLRGHPRFKQLLDLVRGRWERGGTSAEDLAAAPPSVSGARAPVVAVLPLANMSASADDEYFADGITEDIIAQLSQIASLRVISRTSAMGFKKSTRKPKEIAADLGASHVIEGSVRRAGARIRLVATMIDAATEAPVWSETFDRDLTDVFAIQSELAQSVAAALVARLTPVERNRIAKRPTDNLEAYNLYLLGRHHFNQVSADSMSKGIDCYTRAIELDPRFAKVYGALAMVYVYQGGGYWGMRPREAYARATEFARKALAIDPEVADAHEALGHYELWIRYDWSAAGPYFQRAIELDPGFAFHYVGYGMHLSAVGKLAEAVEVTRRALELDQASPSVRGNLIYYLICARRLDEALGEIRAAQQYFGPDEAWLPLLRMWSLVPLGKADEAIPGLQAWASRQPSSWSSLHLATALAAAGRVAEARELLTELHAKESTEYIWGPGLAVAYAFLGDMDRAFHYLERAYEDRAGTMQLIATDPMYDPLRGDPRFDAVVKRIAPVVTAESLQALERMPPRKAKQPVAAQERSPAVKKTDDRKAIAVLPFANLSPDPENEFFADGITDDLIAQVAKIGSLRVIARTSVMRYRGVADAARTAARELGVGAVVEGTVRRAGKRARIVAQLVDAAGDAPIWSETFDRDVDDVFSVQTEVATNVAAALRAALTPAEELRLAKRATHDAKAYDLYLLGRHLYNRRTPEALRAAISHFEEAISRDPQFAAAHAGLADAYVFAGIGYAPIPPAVAFANAKVAADRALAIDPESPEALCAMGLATMQGDWDVARSRAVFERATMANSNHAAAYQFLAWCLCAVGEYAAAVPIQQRAMELDPLNVSLITETGWPYFYAGLYEASLERARRAVEFDPSFGLGHYNVGISLHGLGRFSEAFVAYERALELTGPSPWMLTHYAVAHVENGNRTKAEEVLGTLRGLAGDGIGAWLSIAMVLDAIGRTAEALDAFERAIAENEPFVWAVGVETWLKFPNARAHPRFQALMTRIGIRAHDIPGQRELLLAQRAGMEHAGAVSA